MSAKRELQQAQHALNEAVAVLDAELVRLRRGGLSDTWPLGMGVDSSILRPIHEAYAAFKTAAADLEGRGVSGKRETSRAAGLPRQGYLRRLVLDTLVAHWMHFQCGMTTDAIERQLKRAHQSVSPRMTELEQAELIVDSGKRAPTRYQNEAIVYVPSDHAMQLYLKDTR